MHLIGLKCQAGSRQENAGAFSESVILKNYQKQQADPSEQTDKGQSIRRTDCWRQWQVFIKLGKQTTSS